MYRPIVRGGDLFLPPATIRPSNPHCGKLSLVLLAGLLVAACARFEPKPLSPGTTAADLEGRSLTNSGLRAFLKRNIPDQITNSPPLPWDLDRLTWAAFYYHPSLEVARADWRAASAGVQTAAARPNPATTVSLLHEPVPGAPSPWIPTVNFDLPFETAGKRRFRTQEARELSESARLGIAMAAWQVRSQLRTALLALVSAEQRVKLLEHDLALREDFVARLQQRFQAGAISAAEVNPARIALIRARVDWADAQRLETEAWPRLAAAVGLTTPALSGQQFKFELTVPAAAESLASSEARRVALLGRADILAALADYAASQSALQLEIAKQYPDVHISPGYSWNAGSAGEHDWQLGATVTLPLLNRNKGPIAEATARREASAARFLALQAKIISEIETAVASFRASQTNAAALAALVKAQTAQQQLLRQQLQAGAIDRLQVVTGELELSAVQLAYLDASVRVQQALGAMEDSLQRPFELPGSVFESPAGRRPGSGSQ